MSLVSRLSRRIVTTLLLACIFCNVSAANAEQYKRLVVFGDSLSDNGNLFAITTAITGVGFPPPPYYMGRFSNGPVWVELLAEDLGVPLEDYAVAGANTDINGFEGLPFGIAAQIGDSTNGYISTHPVGDRKALYIIWGGANDYIFGGQQNPAVPVANLTAEIERLAATGARHFLIPNLPDLGSLPFAVGTPLSGPLNALTAGHNYYLAQSIANLVNRRHANEIDITIMDVNTLVRRAVSNPAAFGLSDVTHSFLDTLIGSPDQYLFWDSIHPTEKGHRLLADTAVVAVHDNRKEK